MFSSIVIFLFFIFGIISDNSGKAERFFMTKNQLWVTRIGIAGLIIFFLLHPFSRPSKTKSPVQLDSPDKIVMSTIARVVAVAPNEKIARLSIDTAFEKIYGVERLMNRYDPNSQLSRVNLLAAKEPVKVDKELFDVLQQSVEYGRKTDGAFDITVGPLVDLWKKCAESNSIPTDKQLAQVRKTIGYDKLLLDSNDFSVRFAAEGMKLDLGGIAKGFAVDLAVEEMKKAGAIGGLVAVGGEIGCFGTTEKNEKWIVGIQNPQIQDADVGQNVIARLCLTDRNVSTSGDYRRFYKIGEHHFSHILNPATQKSAGELTSVTIIASNGTQADALATAVSVLGAEKGLELIEKTEDTQALLIKAGSKEIIKSSGVQKFIAE
jgi:thiamine biosynthesis lipoprotein